MSGDITALSVALAKGLPELDGAKKASSNPHFKTRYADMASVIEAIRPIAKHGVWYRQLTIEAEGGIAIETRYIGFGAEITAGQLFVPASKRDPQAYGSALTYARRYSLQTAFGLASEDDDGNAASKAVQSDTLSEEQVDALTAKLVESQSDEKAFCQTYRVAGVSEIPASRFDHAMARVNKKLEGMKVNG